MYSIYGNDVCVYNDIWPDPEYRAINPQLKLADNTAGTLDITLPITNLGYEKLLRLTSEIRVYRNEVEIWSGRIINEKKDFWNNRVLQCEGELAYLNDTNQPPHGFEYGTTPEQYLTALLNNHNSKVSESKKFYIGTVTVVDLPQGEDIEFDDMRWTTNDTQTMSALSSLVSELKGHLRIRKVGGRRYLDYLADFPGTTDQVVRFGDNLIDFTKDWDMTNVFTVVMPRGESLGESDIPGVDEYLDVSSVNAGSRYVTNEEGIKRFGWIEVVVEWSDVWEPEVLLERAKKHLSEVQFDEMVVEASAVDLGYLGLDYQSISLLDRVRLVSVPHGLDRDFPVTQLDIQLDNPQSSIYTLGEKVSSTMTTTVRSGQTTLEEKVSNQSSTIIHIARQEATRLINNATNGYITITKNEHGAQELFISDNIKLEDSRRFWRWNLNGLGYMNKNVDPNNYLVAITMDGAIVADRITTGTLSANRVRTGILQSIGNDPNVVFNLDAGSLTMKNGSINLGNNAFSVTNAGYLIATSGKIGGFNLSATNIYNDGLDLSSGGLYFKSEDKIGSFSVHQIGSNKLITMALDYGAYGTSWAHQTDSNSNVYNVKLLYAGEASGGIRVGRLHAYCDFDLNDYTAQNFWINYANGGCVNGVHGPTDIGSRVRIPVTINSSGAVTSYHEAYIRNGFLVRI